MPGISSTSGSFSLALALSSCHVKQGLALLQMKGYNELADQVSGCSQRPLFGLGPLFVYFDVEQQEVLRQGLA